MKLSKFHITSIIAVIMLLYALVWAYNDQYLPIITVLSLYFIVLIAGSIFIRLNFYLVSRNKLTTGPATEDTGKKIALTFDDGPAAYTSTILDILKEEKATATFFLIGKNIKEQESVIKRMQDEGHRIGNHSYNHGFNFDWQSSQAMQEEIERTSKIIYSITGDRVALFRPPYGVTNPNLAKAAKRAGVQSIGWSLRSMDTVAKNEKRLLNKILSAVKDGDIILLHDSCAVTAAIMPELIRELKSRNYEFTAQIE